MNSQLREERISVKCVRGGRFLNILKDDLYVAEKIIKLEIVTRKQIEGPVKLYIGRVEFV